MMGLHSKVATRIGRKHSVVAIAILLRYGHCNGRAVQYRTVYEHDDPASSDFYGQINNSKFFCYDS
jgi:hypothetical protein